MEKLLVRLLVFDNQLTGAIDRNANRPAGLPSGAHVTRDLLAARDVGGGVFVSIMAV